MDFDPQSLPSVTNMVMSGDEYGIGIVFNLPCTRTYDCYQDVKSVHDLFKVTTLTM
jgi:hypothetical protein